MKTKGITIWERYAERFVLGAAAAAALGFAAMQFLGQPNAVSTTAGTVAPHQVDRVLQERAEALMAKLGDEAPAGLELKDPRPAFDDLRAERERSLSPRPTLALPELAIVPRVRGGEPLPGNAAYPVPALAAPDMVAVRQFTDTLAEGVVAEHADLQPLFAKGVPHDMNFTTVRGRFNLKLLREQFAKLPPSWFNDHPENLVDVVVERQELAGDQWTDSITLAPIPGQTTLRPQLSENLDAGAREEILSWLADPATQLAVIQPDFYALRNGDWDPNWVEGQSGADQKRATLKLQLAELERLLEALHKEGGSMDDPPKGGGPAGAPGTPGAPKGGDAGGGAGGGGAPGGAGSGRRAPPGRERRDAPGKGGDTGGGFGTGGMAPGDSGPGPGKENEKDAKAREQRIKNLKGKIRAQELKIARTKDELRALGVDVDKEAEPGAIDPFAVLKGDTVMVWAHDLSPRPDRTYRYRMVVRVYNPFFGKKRSLVESQQALADAFCIDTPSSEWSSPVTISPPLRIFVTSASAGGTGPARVTAEVYRFYDGTQWMDTFSVAPGGSIGGRKQLKRPGDGAAVEVDFTTGLFVLDVVEKIAEGRAGAADPGGDARVLLHDVRGDRPPMLRDPQVDARSAEREALKLKVPPAAARPA
jgi:hypothetical protein